MWRILPCEFWVLVTGFGAALIVALIGVGFAIRFGGREMKELRAEVDEWRAWAEGIPKEFEHVDSPSRPMRRRMTR